MVVSRRECSEYITTYRLRPADKKECDSAVLFPVEAECMDYFNDGSKTAVTDELFKLNAHTYLIGQSR